MNKRGKIKKTYKPSERESITEFSTTFGVGSSYEKRMKRQRILTALAVIFGTLFLIYMGFFITELFIDITELPA